MAGSFWLRARAFHFCVMHQVIEFYEQNLRLSRQTGDQRGEMAALNSLGRAYAALEERDKAVQCFEQALQIARQLSDLRGERQTLKNLDEILKPPGAPLGAPLSANDETGNQTSPPQKPGQKTRKKATAAKAKSTRNKPAQQRKPKLPRASKKLRQLKDQ